MDYIWSYLKGIFNRLRRRKVQGVVINGCLLRANKDDPGKFDIYSGNASPNTIEFGRKHVEFPDIIGATIDPLESSDSIYVEIGNEQRK